MASDPGPPGGREAPGPAPFTSAELVGLLAEPARRIVFAALVLGATDVAEVVKASGLTTREAGSALATLVGSGLVVRGADGAHHLLGEAFSLAARAEAAQRPAPGTPDAASAEQARVLRAFVRDGRLVAIPMPRAKRLVVLDLLAQEFEPGRRYSEKMVNLILGRWHADTAALRRYLVDEGFLDREAGEYWRTGGTYRP